MAKSKINASLSENPFPGLRPFDVAESPLFFGREHQVEELLRKLTLYHFVSVVGTSGSGKSSLVRAGLLAKLYNGYNAGGSSEWIIAIMRPGANPILNLAKALFTENVFGVGKENRSKVDAAFEILNESPLGLVQIVRANIKRGTNILILADQFEELFRFAGEYDLDAQKHAANFVNLLIEAVRQQDAGIYVVITLRADFLGDCAAFEGLPEAINDGQYLIPRLNREHYKLVVEGPVNYAHGKIAPRLVQQLLNDMSNNQDQLPILQHALMRTWENREKTGEPGEPMDLVNYNAIGTMEHALNLHANEAFDELNERQQKLAELIFKCITVKGSDNRGIRRPTRLNDICAITKSNEKSVIETLEVFRRSGRGFIMPPVGVELLPGTMIDISHESLMRNWKRLEEWVEEEYDSAQMYQRLSDAAILFQNGAAGLWRDPELSVALEWRENNHPHEAWAKQYNDHFEKSMHFLDESIAGKERMLAEKKRRRLITNIIVIIFLLSAGALTLWAMIEQHIAFKSANEAIKETSIAEKSEQTAIKSAAEAEKNYKIGEEQRKMAEDEKQKAENQKLEAIKQKKLADIQSLKTLIQTRIAQRAKLAAQSAQKAAEFDKVTAVIQKNLADSLRSLSDLEKNKAENLQLYQLAKNLALESININDDNNLKALLALEAYKLDITNKSDSFNADIMTALYDANKAFSDNDKYILKGHSGIVKGLAVSPDDKYLASGGDDGKLILWNLQDAKPQPSNLMTSDNEFTAIAFSSDNKWLAASSGHIIYLWDINNLKQKPLKFLGHSDKITSIVFANSELISVGLDKMIIYYNLQNNSQTKDTLGKHILSVAYSKEKNLVAVGTEDGSIYLINRNVKDGAPSLLIKDKAGSEVTGLSFNDNGSVVAGAFSDGSLKIYYTDQPDAPLANKLGKHKSTIADILSGHITALSAVAFGRGNLLASAGLDGKVKLWEWNTSYPPIVFREHDTWVTCMTMGPEGKKVYSGGKDKNIIIYDINKQDIVNRLEKKITRNLSPMEWNQFMGDMPYQKIIPGLQ